MAFHSEGSFTCHTYCDTRLRFINMVASEWPAPSRIRTNHQIFPWTNARIHYNSCIPLSYNLKNKIYCMINFNSWWDLNNLVNRYQWKSHLYYKWKSCCHASCWLIIYGFTSRSRIFHLYGDVTSVGEGLKNFGLCSALRAFKQGGIFIVPHLLWHRTSVFPVSSEGPPHFVASYNTRGDVEDLF